MSQTHTEKARAQVRETVKKITECENALGRSAIAYAEALRNCDDTRCLAELENQDITRRTLRLYNDKLPIHEAAVLEAEKMDAAPEIVAQCIEAQKLCDDEAKLIEAYYAACKEFQRTTEALTQHSHRTNQAMITLKHEIQRVGSTVRPAVNRSPFNKPMHVVENGRQLFAHFTERFIPEIKEGLL